MCPIHDTDGAEERWSQAEWEHYELWEKVEARARRIRRAWISAGAAVFLVLSAVPIVVSRSVQWRGLSAARELSQLLTTLKREAGEKQHAFRITLIEQAPVEDASLGALALEIAWGPSCRSPLFLSQQVAVLGAQPSGRPTLQWVASARAREAGIPNVLQRWCYDPIEGSEQTPQAEDLAAFMITSVNELSLDRSSTVLVSGPSAEISFE